MHRLFKKCILEKKKVIIVSDMYLPMRFFKGCLEKYFREDEYTIYVSSSIGYTKRSGDLWKYILNDLSISSEKILHVGDDYNIDILPAISEGICAYWYRCVDKNLKLYWNKTNIYEDWISGYIEKSGYLNGSGAYRVGYGLIGPVLYYYCFWAHEIVKKTKCTKIIFFAREGYLIKQVYECLFQDNSVELIYMCYFSFDCQY